MLKLKDLLPYSAYEKMMLGFTSNFKDWINSTYLVVKLFRKIINEINVTFSTDQGSKDDTFLAGFKYLEYPTR